MDKEEKNSPELEDVPMKGESRVEAETRGLETETETETEGEEQKEEEKEDEGEVTESTEREEGEGKSEVGEDAKPEETGKESKKKKGGGKKKEVLRGKGVGRKSVKASKKGRISPTTRKQFLP
jgi:hypothetical protein